MKTANEIRNELALSQRMQKTKDKWLTWCEKYTDYSHTEGHNGVKIGDTTRYAVKKVSRGGCINFSAKTGVVFAFNDEGSRMIVVTEGKLHAVNNPVEDA